MRLSENFTLKEYTKSQTASRRGIDNTPTEEHLENAIALFNSVVQKIRDHFGPTIITSGYRSPALNDAIGGASGSQHSKGEAADLEVLGKSNLEVAQWIRDNLVFDQLILEFYSPGDPNSGWVHVSFNTERNRNEVLTACKENGSTVYKKGLIE